MSSEGRLLSTEFRSISYSVGIARIDAQHQRLVDLINDLHAAMVGGEAKSALEKILDGLAAYAVSHFATEEQLMRKFAYPSFEQHKAEHDKLMVQVRFLQDKSRAKTTTLSLEVMTFLKRWLIGHIANVDKKYTAHLNAAGVT